jgi:membrane-associated phospholipid phosphatase
MLNKYRTTPGLYTIAALFTILLYKHACSADYIEAAGYVLEYAMPVSAAGISVYKKDYNGTIQLGESLLLNEIITFSLKYSVNERRPDSSDYESFPSGHTSITSTTSEFLWRRYGWEYGLTAYSLTAFTGYSRMKAKKHYIHDVLAGAAIGFISGYIFTRKYPDKNFMFQISDNKVAISINGYF